jgi:hypothetical protein
MRVGYSGGPSIAQIGGEPGARLGRQGELPPVADGVRPPPQRPRRLYCAYVRLPLHDQRDHSRSAGYSQLNPDDGIWCYLKGVERHGSVTA